MLLLDRVNPRIIAKAIFRGRYGPTEDQVTIGFTHHGLVLNQPLTLKVEHKDPTNPSEYFHVEPDDLVEAMMREYLERKDR